MKKLTCIITILLFLLFQSLSLETIAQASRKNAGQKDGPNIFALDRLTAQEIENARNDIDAFNAKFINAPGLDLGCPDGFAFSLDAFSRMRRDLGIANQCNPTNPNICYSVSIYPAYNGSSLYLVLKGEQYTHVPNTFDNPTTMSDKSYFILKVDNPEDFQEVAPGTILRVKTEKDIQKFQTEFGNAGTFNLKSLRIHLKKYDDMITALKPLMPAADGKFYYMRLRLTYNEFSLQKNKLYSVLNPELATISANGQIFRQIIDQLNSWYNHMDPCPDKCPVDESMQKKRPVRNTNMKRKNK